MVIPPGGDRLWIDLTSTALREDTAGHLTGARFLPSSGNHSWHIVMLLYTDILEYWYIPTIFCV